MKIKKKRLLNNTSKNDSFPQAAQKMEGRRC